MLNKNPTTFWKGGWMPLVNNYIAWFCEIINSTCMNLKFYYAALGHG